MHPLEQLRYVARGWENIEDVPVSELAEMLANLAQVSPATLLHACRRLIEYFPCSGRLWWLAARALSAPEQVEGIWEAAAELDADPTPGELAKALPPGARVSLLSPALPEVVRVLRRARATSRQKDNGAQRIFVVSALAAGPDALLVGVGAAPQLPSAAQVWGVVPRGTVLPLPLWRQLLGRADRPKLVSPDFLSVLIGPKGRGSAADVLSSPGCPPVAELLGWKS